VKGQPKEIEMNKSKVLFWLLAALDKARSASAKVVAMVKAAIAAFLAKSAV
jgi:hypothetical protein